MYDRVSNDLMRLYEKLVERGQERQTRNQQVTSARRGNVQDVLPGVFPENWPKPVIANVLDTTARDLAEVLARMPNIDCSTSNLTTEKAKRFAAKKTKICLYYIEKSRLPIQLFSGADWFFSYAAMPIIVEPDFKHSCPRFRLDSPVDAYWELDLYGEVKVYCKTWGDTVGSLRYKFPELASLIAPQDALGGKFTSDDAVLNVVKLYKDDEIILFLPERQGLVLSRVKHRFGRPPVVVPERPKWDETNRGQFDDVMWVWLARARMALYGLEAADKSVRAPLAVPSDVTQIAFGPDAMVRTDNPEKVRRVQLELPNSSLIESQLLDQEISEGTRNPRIRSGKDVPSVVTGPGYAGLTDVYSTQIATAQTILGDALRRALGMALEMDEVYWPDTKKTVNGTANGAPFTETYVPSKDINGDHTVSVTYGMTAGMDPNRAIVFLLQLRADGALDRDTMQRQLPFEIDVEQLQRRVDIEQMEDAMKQGVFALLANAPVMGEQGIDPIKTLQRAAQIIKDRENGKPFHQAVLDAWQPEEPQGGPLSPTDALMQQLMGGGGGGGEVNPNAANQLGPGGAPDLAMVLAGLTNGGNPNLQFNVSRRLPA